MFFSIANAAIALDQGASVGDVAKSAAFQVAATVAMQGLHDAGILGGVPNAEQGRDPLNSTVSKNAGGSNIATEFEVTNPDLVESIPDLKAAINLPKIDEVYAEMAQETYEVKGPFGIGRERGRFGTINKNTGELYAPSHHNQPLRTARVAIPRRGVNRNTHYVFSLHTHHSVGPITPSSADLLQPEPGLIIHANRGTITLFCGPPCIANGF